MRIVKWERGYIDLDHVLAVSEPYQGEHGFVGFSVTLALREEPLRWYWDNQMLGVDYDDDYHNWEPQYFAPLMDAVMKKRDEFVELWKNG